MTAPIIRRVSRRPVPQRLLRTYSRVTIVGMGMPGSVYVPGQLWERIAEVSR